MPSDAANGAPHEVLEKPLRVESMEPACSGPDGAFFIHHAEIEYAAVRETKRQLRLPLMQLCHIHIVVERRDAALDFEMRWDELGLNVGEVPVDRQVVMDPSYVRFFFEDVAVTDRLLNQSFHSGLLAWSLAAIGSRRPTPTAFKGILRPGRRGVYPL